MDTIKTLLSAAALATVLAITSCGGGSSTAPGSPPPPPPPPPPPVTTVVITPAAASIQPGATQQFMAQVSGPKNQAVTWSVTAGGGTITSAGLYTAPSGTGVFNVVATSAADPNSSATATVVVTTISAAFSPTGNPVDARLFHTATLLPNGKVLVAGGAHQTGYCFSGIASAELYDPVSESFSSTGTMTIERYAQTSTLLPTGEVLMIGGFSTQPTNCLDTIPPALDTAELYNPSQGSFTATGNMAETRGGHTATLLTNGKVLIAGGTDEGGGLPPFYFGNGSATAELYDPAAGLFSSTGNMTAPRVGQTATLLANGKVLVAGGWTTTSSPIASAELYDPATGTFSATGSMTSARAGHTATLLPDSTVLITGGQASSGSNGASNTAELYDPATGSFALIAYMAVARESHTATLLPNGTVLMVGGGTAVAEVYIIPYGYFSPVGVTESLRSGNSATLLQNGSVIVIGGLGGQTTAELYQ
ncbi:MAG: hypothetical protein LAO03_21355 [Acidobacteriia bacterium]|nr:hypothetical protein [Terriglobia bacterium]